MARVNLKAAILVMAVLLAGCALWSFAQGTQAPAESGTRSSVGGEPEAGAETEIDEPVPSHGDEGEPVKETADAGEDRAAPVEVVTGDIVRMGSKISVAQDQEVQGSVVALGGSIEVDGEVTEDVVAIGGRVDLGPNAEVMGDCVSIGGRIDKDPGARVHGDEVTLGFLGFWYPEGEKVGWFLGMPHLVPFGPDYLGGLGLALVAEFFAKAVIVLAVGAFLLLLFPNRVSIVAATIGGQAAKSLGVGILAAVVGIIAFVVSLVLVLFLVGIPLILLEVSLLAAALILGEVAVCLFFGTRLAQGFNWSLKSQFVPLVIGALVFSLLTTVPYAGDVIDLLLLFIATGAVVLSGYGASTDWLSRRTRAQPIAWPPGGGGGQNP